MLSRPWDNAARSWHRIYQRDRLSMRAAIVVGGAVSLGLWLGLAALATYLL